MLPVNLRDGGGTLAAMPSVSLRKKIQVHVNHLSLVDVSWLTC